ncbi:ADP-ribose pyrophosphatase [Xylariales sp. AK1849]|nr:ADP-ribose pyrophosphatase [Xylariales sp. AK1849]
MSEPAARVTSIEPLESKDSKWLKLVKINYTDINGTSRTWEAMKRPTRPKTSAVDAIQIIAILEKPGGPELLLEKQFRPPVGKVVVEFPAGMVDEGETPEQAAVRELREETGFVGDVMEDRSGAKRIVTWNSPASSSSCTYMIHMNIDFCKEENQNPRPELEESEFIECFSIPLKDLYTECRKLESQGFAVDGKVGAFAEGLEMAHVWQGR